MRSREKKIIIKISDNNNFNSWNNNVMEKEKRYDRVFSVCLKYLGIQSSEQVKCEIVAFAICYRNAKCANKMLLIIQQMKLNASTCILCMSGKSVTRLQFKIIQFLILDTRY